MNSSSLLQNSPQSRYHRAAFSLLELLVVVSIIMVVAASSLLILDETDDQARFDKTKQGYKELQTALFGPDMLTKIGGNLVISGYLADTGHLPTSLKDLLVKPVGMPDWQPIVHPDLATTMGITGARLSHGWRGPYISESDTGLQLQQHAGQVVEEGLLDPWGHLWRFNPSDKAILPAQRYRAGFEPVNAPPTLQFGSLGKDGLPVDPLAPAPPTPGQIYDKDYPEAGLTLGAENFVLKSVPLPQRTIRKTTAADLVLWVGVIYPGIDLDKQALTGQPSPVHPRGYHHSLLRYANGEPVEAVFTVRTGGTGGGGSGGGDDDDDSGDDDDDDDDDNEDGGGNDGGGGTGRTVVSVTLPDNMTYNLGYARQLQLALYVRDAQAPNRLGARLYSVDPVVFTYYPKVSSSGTEAVLQNTSTTTWQIP